MMSKELALSFFDLYDDTHAYNILVYFISSRLIYDERLSRHVHVLNHLQPDRNQLQGHHFLHHMSQYNDISQK